MNTNPQTNQIDARIIGDPPAAGATLRLVTWNLGYAALDSESEFIADGGRKLRAAPRRRIAANAAAIADFLRDEEADVALIQEAARAGFMTRGVDVLAALDAAWPTAPRWFHPDVLSRWPRGRRFGLAHGVAAYARRRVIEHQLVALPQEPRPIAFRLRRRYAALSLRLPIAGAAKRHWRLFCVHFSAFDRHAQTRNSQLAALMQVAQRASAAGDFVIIGGDFNLDLTEASAAAAPAPALEWRRAFPTDLLPAGWRVVCDPETPTARGLAGPYRAGETPICVIDGFIVAPDVEVLACAGVNLDFRRSDHHPVRLAARPASL